MSSGVFSEQRLQKFEQKAPLWKTMKNHLILYKPKESLQIEKSLEK
jgi:hypothetical protein